MKIFSLHLIFFGVSFGFQGLLGGQETGTDELALVTTDTVLKNVVGNPENDAKEEKIDNAANWFPDQTQGFVRVLSFPKFLERWNETQLGKLGKHDLLKEFWKEQKKEIENRFAEAGWQLNLKAEDIAEVATGQVAVGWIARPQLLQKPYSVLLTVSVADKKSEVEQLLAKVDKELKARQATSQKIDFKGNAITKYTLPLGPGQLVIRESLYAVADETLFAADDLISIQGALESKRMGLDDSSLANSKLYGEALKGVPMMETGSDVEYFVRPIGLAKLLRSISGKPISTQTDVLKVLDNQGFGNISAATGRLRFADRNFDIFHEAFVKIELPLKDPVKVLDFPNLVGKEIPSWVTPQASSFLAVAWNANAFWNVEPIVDELAGQEGVFDSVIEGIHKDPVGPQIDIAAQVLPYITPEIYSISDIVLPISPDSRRTLIAIRILDPAGKLAAVLDRAMRNEPDASPEDFEGYRIWKVTRQDDSNEALKIESDFGDFNSKGNKSPKAKNVEEEPLLSNWAITIISEKNADKLSEQFLMFASHAEMIKEAIVASKKIGVKPLLSDELDVQRVLKDLNIQAAKDGYSGWQINRSDKAFQMQYELFREGKLPQSKSMLATLLDRILRPKDELKNVNQRVKGNKLPPYEFVREYLMPGGSRVQTRPDGWSYQGFILGKP